MKVLQKYERKLYRFRCDRCRSLFEMTEEEKLDNDWEYNSSSVWKKEDREDPCARPHNPTNKFYCPICEAVRHVYRDDIHEYHIMNDGIEIQKY